MRGHFSRTAFHAAFDDVRNGLDRHEFWRTFALDEIVSRYRRSRLGQFWITLSVAFFIFVIGGLYRDLFASNRGTYFAYMAVGYLVWLFVSDIVNKSGAVFMGNKTFILQSSMPFSVYCYRLVLSEIYVFLHHVVILPPIFIYLALWPGIEGLLQAALGLLIVVYSSFWIALIIGILSLRYRDLIPITQSLLRTIFFATPIIWLEKDLGAWGNLINMINPLRYLLTVVRAPLLNQAVGTEIYMVTIVIVLALTLAGLTLLAFARNKIAYWL